MGRTVWRSGRPPRLLGSLIKTQQSETPAATREAIRLIRAALLCILQCEMRCFRKMQEAESVPSYKSSAQAMS
jgi:hypothetical protein